MKRIKKYNVGIWFKSVTIEETDAGAFLTVQSDNKITTSSAITRIEYCGLTAIEGYTIDIETQNSIYKLTDFTKENYFGLMQACPIELRGMDWFEYKPDIETNCEWCNEPYDTS